MGCNVVRHSTPESADTSDGGGACHLCFMDQCLAL